MVYAQLLLLPPGMGVADRTWSSITTEPTADGGMVIRATVPDGTIGYESCSYRDVTITTDSRDRVTATSWTNACSQSGQRSVTTTATYGPPIVKGPMRPRLSTADALKRLVRGSDRDWPRIAAAVNRTVARRTSDLVVREVVRLSDGELVESRFDLAGGVIDPSNGQPAYSATVDGAPRTGWHPDWGYWVAVDPGDDRGTLAAAVSSVGRADADYVTDGTAAFAAKYGSIQWVLPASAVDRQEQARIAAIRMVDFFNVDQNQPGRVTRTKRADGSIRYLVVPSKGRKSLSNSDSGPDLRLEVIVRGGAAVSVAYTYEQDEGPGGAPANTFGRITRTQTIGGGLANLAGPVGPAVPYSEIAPLLP